MKAAVVRAFGEPVRIEDVVLDPPQRDEVRVQIGAIAVCGSDLHASDGAWGGTTPVVNGHEAAGVVAELGPAVSSVNVGDHVVVSLMRSCGACFTCRRDQTHLCEASFALDTETRLHDAAGTPIAQGIYVGGFAEEVVVHASQVVAIDRTVPLDAACLLACGVPTGYGAVVHTARVPAGSSVVVVGVGGVGINCIQGAVAVAAAPIVAVDLNDDKLSRAVTFGATATIRADVADLPSDVASLTSGRGADYVFVAAGSTRAVESGLALVRPGGTLVVVGITQSGEHARFEMSEFASSSRTVIGSKMGSTNAMRDTPALVKKYLDGELLLGELITGRFALDDLEDAIALVRSGESLRNVIVFTGVGS